MQPVMLFRRDRFSQEEFDVAGRYLPVLESRSLCRDNLVIGRYSVLPFYRELELDLAYGGSILINTYPEHAWIADFHYYDDLRDFTPETWTDATLWQARHDGPFVVKGRTNSKKHHWDTLMVASTKRQAVEVACRLRQDSLIATQEIIYRSYVPLKTFEIGLNGLPFTNEYRCFFLGERLLAAGYYWTEAEDADKHIIPPDGIAFAQEVARIAARHARFFVLDVAEKADGGWILIEINEGQMSGLSMIEPDVLYSNLALALKE